MDQKIKFYFIRTRSSVYKNCFLTFLIVFGFLENSFSKESGKLDTGKSESNTKKVEKEKIVSKIVGSAADQVVTSREVQIVNFIEKVLGLVISENKNPSSSKNSLKEQILSTKVLDIADKKFNLEVSQVLLEIVVLNESLVFETNFLNEVEFKEILHQIQNEVSVSSDWKKLQVSSAELEKFLRRKLTAKKFIQNKSDSLKGFITDSEAKDYFEKNRLKFGQVPFSQFKENIKTFLSQQQLEERLTAWFEIIKKKYKVKNYLNEVK